MGTVLKNIVMDQNNKVVRVSLIEWNIQRYWIKSFDASTVAFIKKTIETRGLSVISIDGPPEVDLCHEALEALYLRIQEEGVKCDFH